MFSGGFGNCAIGIFADNRQKTGHRRSKMPKRGENIYKRKDGRWEGRYRSGYKADGKAKYCSVYGRSYQEVRAKLLPLKTAPVTVASSGNLTVKALLTEWLGAVQLRVKASTYANYCMKIERHILPAFGMLRYEQLTPDKVHDFIRKKLENGLSAKYVSDIVVLMKSMTAYLARVHGYRNPLEFITLPKSEKVELQLLTPTQQKSLINHLMTDLTPTTLCVLLSLYLGFRIGEVCGLQWGDVDFDKSTITVSRTVQRISNGHGTYLMIGTPKSEFSRRTIPIPSFISAILWKFRRKDSDYILSECGHVTEPRTLQRRFKVILQKVGLPSRGYHVLRHLFATNSIQAGFDVRTLSEILGHSSVSTTLSRYVHSSMERKRECMRLLTPPK